MKQLTLICSFLLLGNLVIIAQQEATFKMALRTDTILLGNYFEVKFALENGQGENFAPPSFEGFDVIGGPNQSSSFSMVNGVTSQSLSFGYYLQPKEVGNYFIEPSSIEVGDMVLETQPIEIIVLPNPDEKKVDYRIREEHEMNLDFWGLNKRKSEIEKGVESEKEENSGKGEKKKKSKKKKKKRKTYTL